MASAATLLSRSETVATREWVGREADGGVELDVSGRTESLAQVLDRPRVPATWSGEAAARLGLTGEAAPDDIRQVLEDGKWKGQKLRTGHTSRVTYGAVITAPKSISALGASDDPAVREAVDHSMDAARDAYVRALEETLTSRRGENGVKSVRIKGVAATAWRHRTSSAGDPHDHVHLLISASAPGPDGKWRTIDSKVMLAAKRVAEATAAKAMKDELHRRLDLPADAWTWRRTGSTLVPEIKALTPYSDSISSARRHIEDVAENDLGKVLDRSTWRERLTAWRKHRLDKADLAEKIEHELDDAIAEGGTRADALRDVWRDRLGTEGAAAVKAIRARPTPQPLKPAPARDTVEAWKEARKDPESKCAKLESKWLNLLTEQHGGWTLADVAALAIPSVHGDPQTAYRLAGTLVDAWSEAGLVTAPDKMTETVNAYLSADQVKTETLHKRVGLHARCVTSDALKIEAELRENSREAAAIRRTPLAVDVTGLSDEQAEAARVAAKGRGYCALAGVAGAGKSHTLSPIVRAAEAKGVDVISVSRNAKRAREVAEDLGISRHTTIASFKKMPRFTKPTMVLLDEGGLVDAADYQKLIGRALGEQVQIVATGDREQSQAIDRAAAWQVTLEGAQAEGQVAHLKKSWRNQVWEAEATAIREGDSDLVDRIEDRRIMPIADHEHGHIAKVAAGIAQQGNAVTLIARSNDTAAALARAVQHARGIEPTHRIARDQSAGLGDIVRTRRNDRRLGVTNGDEWVVSHVHDDGRLTLSAKGDESRTTSVPPGYAREAVELAYAGTADSLQGVTCAVAVPVLDGSDYDRQLLYSAATRGKQPPFYVVQTGKTPDKTTAKRVLRSTIERDGKARTAAEIAAALQEAESEKPKADEKPKASEMDVSEMFASKEQLAAAYQQQQRERDEARARQNPRFIDPVPRPRGMRPR